VFDRLQPRLPIDLPEPVERPRRRRRTGPSARSQRGKQTLTLMQEPVMQRCALCGSRQTVLGDAAVCQQCNGLIFREEKDD